MKQKPTIIDDPELGRIKVPSSPPVSTPRWNAMRARIRAKLTENTAYEEGKQYRCGSCGRLEVRAATDLQQEFEKDGQIVVVANLRGARCHSCGAQALEPSDIMVLDDLAQTLAQPPEHASVTRIGRGTVGTYWPKGVERGLDLRPGDRMQVRVLTPSSALILIEHDARAGLMKTATPTRPSRKRKQPGSTVRLRS